MRTKPTVKNLTPVPSFNLSSKREEVKLEMKINNFDFWTTLDYFEERLPDLRTRVKTNSERKRLLAKRTQKMREESNPETPANTALPELQMLDYLPLCCEEDLEMIAANLSKL
jgi:hypothetical protein